MFTLCVHASVTGRRDWTKTGKTRHRVCATKPYLTQSLFFHLATPTGDAPSDIPIGFRTPFALHRFAVVMAAACRSAEQREDADSPDLTRSSLELSDPSTYQQSTAQLFFMTLM